MAGNVLLDLTTMGGGALMDDFDAALRVVQAGLLDVELIDKPRKITVEVTLTPKDDGFVTVSHAVKTTLPALRRTGAAWQENGEFVTRDDMKAARRGTDEDPRQLHIPTDPAGRRQ